MFEIPDAEPTWSAETDDVEPADAGPLARPRPTASAISGTTNAAYVPRRVHEREVAEADRRERRTRDATALAPPILAASGVIAGVMAIMPAAAGSVASPAWNALMSSAAGSWK